MTKREVLALSNSEIDKVVRIQGTKFDRKRKVTNADVTKMEWLRACGLPYADIAEAIGVSITAVKYHLDPSFRFMCCHRGGTHATSEVHDRVERQAYKRSLISANAHVIYPMR